MRHQDYNIVTTHWIPKRAVYKSWWKRWAVSLGLSVKPDGWETYVYQVGNTFMVHMSQEEFASSVAKQRTSAAYNECVKQDIV